MKARDFGRATELYISRTGETVLKYHNTEVVSYGRGVVVLNHGGWKTATTKRRMNQFAERAGLKYRVFQKDFRWYVRLNTIQALEWPSDVQWVAFRA